MQGSEMFSEGLAQYSSLMVMEKAFGKQKLNRFLKYELDNYLSGRASESEYENPLLFTEQQQYIHYNKASLIYYYLKEMIGEDKFNGALRNIITKYAYKPAPFPTAYNVVDEFRAATPDSLKYLITDLFETITIFNNRVEKVTVTPTADKQYKVELSVICEKLRGDKMGNEKQVALNDYIDIGLFAKNNEDGDELGKPILYNRVKLNQKKTMLTYIVPQKPYQVGVDPYHYLIDKVISDNLKKVD
jgi:aminopeptidase N